VVDGHHVNAEMSFYRGLFGLAPGPVTEFMEPYGRLRSRDLRLARTQWSIPVVLERAARDLGY